MTVVRSLTIEMNNASPADIIVNHGGLTGGAWENNSEPQPGSVVSPGSLSDYVNGASNAFQILGGTILFTPASGGSITVTWTWPLGSKISATTTGNSLTGLAVTASVINEQTANPMLQVVVSPASVVASLVQSS